jgi:hypothetical protein
MAKTLLPEDDDVIKAVSPDRSVEPFSVPILHKLQSTASVGQSVDVASREIV